MRFQANNKGFTLIEILVVLALTMMVMGLIFGPLIQTFKITRRAETIIRAQDNARFALAQVTGDLSNAIYVYDNTADPINFPVLNSLGNVVDPPPRVLYAKVDMVLPKMRGYCPKDTLHTPGGIQRGDETTTPVEAAPICPVCGEPLELKPVEPLIPDTVIVRYFIGLKYPTQPYYNGFNYKLAEADKEDNTYILYRVEFDPRDPALFTNVDPSNFNNNLSDPNFFYNSDFNGYTNPDNSEQTYAQAWRSISRPVVTLNDIDLVTIEFDPNGNPIVTPTVKFAPTAVYNDPLVPTSGTDEEPDRGDAPPAMYRASYGHWVLPYKVVLDNEDVPNVIYETMPGLGGVGSEHPSTDMCIYKRSGSDDPVFVFNIRHYLDTKDASPYGIGDMWPTDIDEREKAFTVDTVKGTVNCAFPNCYAAYCAGLNSNVATAMGGDMALSELADTMVINNDKYRRLLINKPPASGLDPRVLSNGIVVPGSVKVIAPNALKLKNPPDFVQYSRSAFYTQDPGINQFSVDVAHDTYLDGAGIEQPCPGSAAIYFHVPRTAEPSGYVTFPLQGKSDVLMYYEVQNNFHLIPNAVDPNNPPFKRNADRLRANYVTKDLMTIIMGIRIYDTNSGKVQAIQLTNKMRLKNVAE